MNPKTSCLATERLFLYDITEQDTELIVEWRSNPDVYQYFSSPHPLKTEEHLRWFQNSYCQDENCLFWMAETKDNKEKVGVFGLKRDGNNPSSADVSYILSPECRGKGYAREAVECIIKYAREEWNCSLVSAKVHIENQSSVKFAEKLGFAPVGRKGNFILYQRCDI